MLVPPSQERLKKPPPKLPSLEEQTALFSIATKEALLHFFLVLFVLALKT